ncbi:MAG: hypothetical protein IH889_00300 [Planctomycetes bacterium]|nr:hypothetical protein [Planctomycetota bacterium]
MLSPPVETFKASKAILAIVVVLGFCFLYFAASVMLYALVVLGVFALLIFWLLSVSVMLYQDGISYRSLFGSKEMRWDEVERFYYSSVKRSINFIPVGTYYRFKFVNGKGQKIFFGNRMERPSELGAKLIQYTYEPLLRKAATIFDSGIELDFGPIHVSKGNGIRVKKWFRFIKIPWEQLADYQIQKGTFYVWRLGKKYSTGSALSEVPNAFVLLGLLDVICKPNA